MTVMTGMSSAGKVGGYELCPGSTMFTTGTDRRQAQMDDGSEVAGVWKTMG